MERPSSEYEKLTHHALSHTTAGGPDGGRPTPQYAQAQVYATLAVAAATTELAATQDYIVRAIHDCCRFG
jgi:hypothetical protein